MLYAFDLFDNKKFSDSMKIFLQLDTDPSEVIKLFPELTSSPNKPTNEPSLPKSHQDDSGLLALIEYLTEVRQKVQKNNGTNGKTTESENEIDARIKRTNFMLETIDTTLLKCYLQVSSLNCYVDYFSFSDPFPLLSCT